MGIICGGGLLLCLVPMMTLLPVLLLRGRQNVIDHQHTEDETRARIENIWLQRPVLVIGVTVALCALALHPDTGKVKFDYNLMELQSPSLPSVVFEQKLTACGQIPAVRRDRGHEPGPGHCAGGKDQTTDQPVADVEPPADMFENFIDAEPDPKTGIHSGHQSRRWRRCNSVAPDTTPGERLCI